MRKINKLSEEGITLSQQAMRLLFPKCEVKLTRCDFIGNIKIEILEPETTILPSSPNEVVKSEPGKSRRPGKKSGCYECDICGKVFTMSYNLMVHKRVHTDLRPYKCQVCGKRSRQLGHIRRHVLSLHQRQDQDAYSYEPEDLSSSTTSKPVSVPPRKKAKPVKHKKKKEVQVRVKKNSSLTKDGKSLTTKKCTTCKKIFSSRNNLQIHLRLHTNERPYICRACGKAFKQCGHVQKHISNRHPDAHRSFYEIQRSGDTQVMEKGKKRNGKKEPGKTFMTKGKVRSRATRSLPRINCDKKENLPMSSKRNSFGYCHEGKGTFTASKNLDEKSSTRRVLRAPAAVDLHQLSRKSCP